MNQPLNLAAIQARCDAATEGPWYPDYIDGAVHDPEGRFVAQTTVNDPNPDVAFIAAARADLPALIARVRELTAGLTEMTHCRDAALRALHRDDTDIDIDVEDAVANALWGPGWDWEDERTPRRIARDVAPAIRPALAKTTQQRDAALARVAELEASAEAANTRLWLIEQALTPIDIQQDPAGIVGIVGPYLDGPIHPSQTAAYRAAASTAHDAR